MSNTTPVKANSVVVLAHQLVTHKTTVVGSSIATVTKRAVTIYMFHGYVEAADDANPGKFQIQTRPDPGGGTVNEHWVTVNEYVAKGTTPDDEAMTAIEPAGEKVLAVAATAGFAAGDELYIQDVDNLASSEWATCQEFVTNTSIDILDGLTVEKPTAGGGSKIFNDASKFTFSFDLNASESYRVVWSHEGDTGADGHIKALAITHDSDLTT